MNIKSQKSRFCLFGFLSLLVILLFSPAHADVQLPEGYYFETTVDLNVKALGGSINAERTWFQGKWYFNRSWEDLIFEYDSIDGSIASITRGEDEYKKNGAIFAFGSIRTITQSTAGFTWQDRKGNSIVYDTAGKITEYSNRNAVKVTFSYDTNGNRSGVFDHNGVQRLWVEYDASNRVTAVRDTTNRRVEYRYTGDNLTEVIDVLGNSWQYAYTGGRLTTLTDAENRPVTIAYNTGGRVAKISDTLGVRRTYSYDYDKSKRLFYVRTQTGGGKLTETWYDTEGFVTRRDLNGKTLRTVIKDGRDRLNKDSFGNVTRNDYDEFRNIVKTTYADNSAVSYQFEYTFTNITKKTDELGVVTTYAYDANGNLLKMTEATGLPEQRITEYRYDAFGNRTEIKRLGDAVTQLTITAYTYDSVGNRKTRTDAEGGVETYTSDVMGNQLTRKDALNNTWIRTYDVAGRLLSIANPLGHATTIGYDKVGNLIQITDPLNRVTALQYDVRDNLTQQTDALLAISGFAYNANESLTTITDEEGKLTQLSYNNDNYLTALVDGEGNRIQLDYSGPGNRINRIVYPTFTQELRYDRRNRRTVTLNVLDAQTQYTTTTGYDRRGRQLTQKDAKGRLTSNQYDALGRLIKSLDADGSATTQSYDARDNLLSLTDPNGNVHSFEYDRINRKLKEISPLGEVTALQYDGIGQLTRKSDAKGQRIDYAYDTAGRLSTTKHFTTLAATTPTKTTNFSFDSANNLTGYNDGTSSATYAYDKLNRRTGETINFGSFSRAISYSYYKNGSKKSYTDPDGVTYNYTYNGNNQVTGIAIPGQGSIITNGYNWVAPAGVSLPGGTTQTYDYDALLRVKTINVKDPAQNPIMNYEYTYDPESNILSKLTEHGSYDYSYDTLDRLTGAATPQGTEAFTYDAAGNRLTENGVAGSWNYNANNPTYLYDSNGNTTQKTDNGVITNYSYDINNRLVKVDDNNGNTIGQYYYDPFGRRLWKEVNSQRTYFFYTDEGMIAEFTGAGSTIRSYGYAPDSTWGTDPLFQKTGSNYAYYQNDHLATPQKLTSASGAVEWEARQKSFGAMDIITEAVSSDLRFPGQYYDAETGLYYNWNRYYDPSTGRYITSDPIGLDGGINTFGYVGGNPLIYIDPAGLKKYLMITVTTAGGVAVIASGAVGLVVLVDLCTLNLDIFSYYAYGLGLGFGGAASLESGVVDVSNPSDIAGRGLEVSGFAARPGRGVSATVIGSGPVPRGHNSYTGVGIGVASGAGAGISGMATVTEHITSNGSLSDLPQNVIDLISSLEPNCEDACSE